MCWCAAVVVGGSWGASVLAGAPHADLRLQLATWVPTAFVTTDLGQRLLRSGSRGERVVLRVVVMSSLVATATAATGVGFLFPVVVGLLVSRILQKTPTRAGLSAASASVVVGSSLVQLHAHLGLDEQILPAAAGDLSTAVLAVLTLVGLGDTFRLARTRDEASAALLREHRRRHDELLVVVRQDQLTGALSRRGFQDEVERRLSRLPEPPHPSGRGAGAPGTEDVAGLGLVYLDLDGFKPVNDRHGHDTGDAVLRQAVERFRGVLRADDTIARVGGDEFVVLLRAHHLQDVHRVAAALVRAMDSPVDVATDAGAVRLPLGVSAGAAFTGHRLEQDALLGEADRRMYAHKRERHTSRPREASRRP